MAPLTEKKTMEPPPPAFTPSASAVCGEPGRADVVPQAAPAPAPSRDAAAPCRR